VPDFSTFHLSTTPPHGQVGRRLVVRTIDLEESSPAIAEMDGYARVGVTVIDRF
jgi:hypothetical protein